MAGESLHNGTGSILIHFFLSTSSSILPLSQLTLQLDLCSGHYCECM